MNDPSPTPVIRFSRRRTLALASKELAQIRRDPSTFLIAFVLPMILLFLFGFAISLDNSHTRVALVIEDDSVAAADLGAAFQNSRYFDIVSARSVAAVRDRMVDGSARAIIVIPGGFGAGVKRRNIPQIQVITDGSQPNVAGTVGAYAEAIRADWAARTLGLKGSAATPPVELSMRFWYNPELKSRNMLVPGSIAIVITMIGSLLTALVVAREWERGTMEAIMATPISMVEFILSKIVPYFFLALVSTALCTIVAVTVFGVPFRGSLFALFCLSSAFLMPSVGMGLLISSATKNQFVASQIALMSGMLPAMLLSGFLFEISSMPVPVQAITYLVPARYLIPSLQTVFLAGDVWSLFLPAIGIMLGFGVFFFFLSFLVTRRSLD